MPARGCLEDSREYVVFPVPLPYIANMQERKGI